MQLYIPNSIRFQNLYTVIVLKYRSFYCLSGPLLITVLIDWLGHPVEIKVYLSIYSFFQELLRLWNSLPQDVSSDTLNSFNASHKIHEGTKPLSQALSKPMTVLSILELI